jgi:uncharacterized protein YkwD
MFRVLLPTTLCLALTACGGSQKSVDLGLNDSGGAVAPSKVGSDRATATVKTASLGDRNPADRAPSGTSEKAPKGALADRNYGDTKLDVEQARMLINAYRKQHNLKPVELHPQLTSAAKDHARDLAKWDRISHYGSDGSNPWDRVKRSGYNPRVAAENVGTGQASVDEVFKGWRESEGHNKNLLLPDATQMGIALVRDPKTEFKTFWALVMGAPQQ